MAMVECSVALIGGRNQVTRRPIYARPMDLIRFPCAPLATHLLPADQIDTIEKYKSAYASRFALLMLIGI